MRRKEIATKRTAMVELYGRKMNGGVHLDTSEISYIMNECTADSLPYYLVLLQQAKYITCEEELSDAYYANLLNVSEVTIKRKRLSLIKAKMLKFIKKGGMTIVLLGYESVLIYELTDCDVVKVDAIKRVKKVLDINSIHDFLERLGDIKELYASNPEMFDK